VEGFLHAATHLGILSVNWKEGVDERQEEGALGFIAIGWAAAT